MSAFKKEYQGTAKFYAFLFISYHFNNYLEHFQEALSYPLSGTVFYTGLHVDFTTEGTEAPGGGEACLRPHANKSCIPGLNLVFGSQ